jgi:hypothetical protein
MEPWLAFLGHLRGALPNPGGLNAAEQSGQVRPPLATSENATQLGLGHLTRQGQRECVCRAGVESGGAGGVALRLCLEYPLRHPNRIETTPDARKALQPRNKTP